MTAFGLGVLCGAGGMFVAMLALWKWVEWMAGKGDE